jgi:phosphoserine phosphatase RsbU/P
VGDVSGHGLGPAIVMAETRAALRTLARTTDSVGEALAMANEILLDGLAEGKYITLILAGLDPVRRTLTYANAGHPDGLIFDPDGSIAARLPSSGCPLGVLEREEYATGSPIDLRPGQIVLLFTDGIVESTPPSPVDFFGMDRLTRFVREHQHLPAQEILDRLETSVREYCRPVEPLDDITAVALKVL